MGVGGDGLSQGVEKALYTVLDGQYVWVSPSTLDRRVVTELPPLARGMGRAGGSPEGEV